MSYNFSNGRPSGSMPWVDQYWDDSYSPMAKYGAPVQTSSSPLIPQMSMAPVASPIDLSQKGLDAMSNTGSNPGAAVTPGGWGQQLNSWLKETGITGTKEDPGWGGMAMGAASGISSAMLGWGQYNLAKDTLAQHKQEYAANYDAQKRTTNASMEDRQRARIASNAGGYQSVGDYMSKNGIK